MWRWSTREPVWSRTGATPVIASIPRNAAACPGKPTLTIIRPPSPRRRGSPRELSTRPQSSFGCRWMTCCARHSPLCCGARRNGLRPGVFLIRRRTRAQPAGFSPSAPLSRCAPLRFPRNVRAFPADAVPCAQARVFRPRALAVFASSNLRFRHVPISQASHRDTGQGEKGGLEKGSLPLSRRVHHKPARSDGILPKQLLNFIPRSRLNQTARKTGVDSKARTFSVLSHLAVMLFAQLSHAIRLNDLCDWLRLKAAALSRSQNAPAARPPQRSFPPLPLLTPPPITTTGGHAQSVRVFPLVKSSSSTKPPSISST
jgi:hypothetical protein